MASVFLEVVKDTYIFQQVKENTRYRTGNEPSLLDLVLTSVRLGILTWSSKIGHVCLNFTYNCFIEAAFRNFIILNIHKCGLKGYESEIEAVNWKTKIADLN